MNSLGSVSTKTTQLKVRKFQSRRVAYNSPQQMRGAPCLAFETWDTLIARVIQSRSTPVNKAAKTWNLSHYQKPTSQRRDVGHRGAKYRSAHLRETVGQERSMKEQTMRKGQTLKLDCAMTSMNGPEPDLGCYGGAPLRDHHSPSQLILCLRQVVDEVSQRRHHFESEMTIRKLSMKKRILLGRIWTSSTGYSAIGLLEGKKLRDIVFAIRCSERSTPDPGDVRSRSE